MADRKIGAVHVEIGAKGLEGLQSVFAKVGNAAKGFASTLDSIAKKANDISNKAALPFAALTASVGKAASVASPVTWEKMGLAFDKLSLQVGRIFIPIIQDVTRWVSKLADYFASLDGTQRQQIEGWTRLALGVGAVLVIVPKLVSAFSSLSMLMNPIGLAIAALGIAFSTLEQSDISKILQGIGDTFKWLWDIVSPVVTAIGDGIAEVIGGIGALWDMVKEAIPGVGGIFETVFSGIGKLITGIVDALKWVVDIIQKFVVVVGTVAKSVSDWEFSGMGDKITANLEEFESKKAGNKAAIKDTAGKMGDSLVSKATGGGKKADEGRYSPEIRLDAPRVSDLTGAYRSLQTAAQGAVDPKLALEQERLKIAQADTKTLQQIADNTKKATPIGQQ